MASERTNKPTVAGVVPTFVLRDRKKVGLAVGLVLVVGLMWGRVLMKHKPQGAAAAAPAPAASKTTSASKALVNVKYVNLPVIPGRNDTIDCDFFTGRDWSGFARSAGTTSPNTEVVRPDMTRTSETIGKVAEKLNVQAVLLKSGPKAFINDQLVGIGDTLSLRDGADLYLFEVKQIRGDSVLVECRGQSVTLKMKQ